MNVALDHIVWGVPDLDEGMAEFSRRTGVMPRAGGHHPEFGTHNALAALGSGTYLELLARDPDHESAPVGLGALVETLYRSMLVTFAARVEYADALAARAREAGLVAEIVTGSRVTPQGDQLEWRNVVLGNHGYAESMPFFIEWGHGTTHPAETSPEGCSLEALELRHPEPGALAGLLGHLGVHVPVRAASRPGMVATLGTPNGTVVLH